MNMTPVLMNTATNNLSDFMTGYKTYMNSVDWDFVKYSVLLSCILSISISCVVYRCEKRVRNHLILDAIHEIESKVKIRADMEKKDLDEYIHTYMIPFEEKMNTIVEYVTDITKICPQMSQRILTFGVLDATWTLRSMFHADLVILEYSLHDIITDKLVSTFQTRYIYLNIPSYPSKNTEITIPPGLKLNVLKATRISKGLGEINDLTSEAKAALEYTTFKIPR